MTTSSPLFSALQLTYTVCECAYRSKDRALVLGLSITAYPEQERDEATAQELQCHFSSHSINNSMVSAYRTHMVVGSLSER